jgi:uncharacterized protein YoxC
MKLPTKSQVQVELARERKAQIDEGVRIAQKVDSLRNTLSSLEKQHNEFINSMETGLKAKVKPLEEEIKAKKAELVVLEDRKRELSKPLDEEWKKVKEEKIKLEQKEKEFDEKFAQVESKREFLEKKALELKDIQSRIRTQERELAKVYSEALTDNKETAEILLLTKEYESDQRKVIDEEWKRIEVERNENKISSLANKNREEQLNRKQKELGDKEIEIRDKYKTLERTLKRIK